VQSVCGPTTNHGSPRRDYATTASAGGLPFAQKNMQYIWRQKIIAVVLWALNQFLDGLLVPNLPNKWTNKPSKN
jgi:hypothetical protein